MPPSASPREVERQRQRLNSLALAVPGQFLSLVSIYWLRFVPALRPFDFEAPGPPRWFLLICAAGLLVPHILPSAYFKPRAFERGGFYPALGLRWFRLVAPDGDWINRRLQRIDPSYRVIRDRRTRAEHLSGSVTNERWHTSWLILGLVTAGWALRTQQFGWAVAVTMFNVAFNLYPVLHQRYKRARVRR